MIPGLDTPTFAPHSQKLFPTLSILPKFANVFGHFQSSCGSLWSDNLITCFFWFLVRLLHCKTSGYSLPSSTSSSSVWASRRKRPGYFISMISNKNISLSNWSGRRWWTINTLWFSGCANRAVMLRRLRAFIGMPPHQCIQFCRVIGVQLGTQLLDQLRFLPRIDISHEESL